MRRDGATPRYDRIDERSMAGPLRGASAFLGRGPAAGPSPSVARLLATGGGAGVTWVTGPGEPAVKREGGGAGVDESGGGDRGG